MTDLFGHDDQAPARATRRGKRARASTGDRARLDAAPVRRPETLDEARERIAAERTQLDRTYYPRFGVSVPPLDDTEARRRADAAVAAVLAHRRERVSQGYTYINGHEQRWADAAETRREQEQARAERAEAAQRAEEASRSVPRIDPDDPWSF